jgi:hypothetical protein
MKHIKLFEEFSSLNEGKIPIYGPGDPYNPIGSTQWTGLVKKMDDWKASGQSFIVVADVDYDMYTTDPNFRSKANMTWQDKSLPLFTSKYPRYQEVEFDYQGMEPNELKPHEVWIRITDKKGVEFKIHPFHVLDIQLGSSAAERIHAGNKYLIKSMRATIVNFKNNVVEVKLQDGSKMNIPIEQWRRENYTEIDENKNPEVEENTELI